MSVSHKRDSVVGYGRSRKTRPKTFTSEEAANKWAKDNKISKYVLENLKNADSKIKKIRVCY